MPLIKKYKGKKWASGTTNSSINLKQFLSGSGSLLTLSFIEVNGLNFKPSYILVYAPWGTNSGNFSIYNVEGLGIVDYPKTKIQTGSLTANSITTGVLKGLQMELPATVSDSGFTIPFIQTNSVCNWIAIE